MNKKVSIIVCTYNSNWWKLKATICQIIAQKDVDYQLIISDDGSKEPHFEETKEYVEEIGVKDYLHIRLDRNQGTVKNVLNALQYVTGDYIYVTSPGDILYDEYAIKDMLSFIISKNVDVCFGDAVGYSCLNEELHIYGKVNRPLLPDLFNGNYEIARLSFFLGNRILGPTFFFRREGYVNNLNVIGNAIKYAEDTMGRLVGFLNDQTIAYYPRKVVWYEVGTGISTSGDINWRKILSKEYVDLYCYLVNNENVKYPQLLKWIKYSGQNRIKRWVLRILFHPQLALRIAFEELKKSKETVECEDLDRLRSYIGLKL